MTEHAPLTARDDFPVIGFSDGIAYIHLACACGDSGCTWTATTVLTNDRPKRTRVSDEVGSRAHRTYLLAHTDNAYL